MRFKLFLQFCCHYVYWEEREQQIMNNIAIILSEGLAYVGQLSQQMVNAI